MSTVAPRIGCVRYLNALPLMHGYPDRAGEVIYEHPSRLAALLEEGAVDAALVPAYELFALPGWQVVDGVSIACDGPVYSVFMAYKGGLEQVDAVSLDRASLTSANLLRCLLAEYHGMRPDFSREEAQARLLIGNQAIAFRKAHAESYNYLDLGQEWKERTGLPFVFALWLIRPECPQAATLASQLRASRDAGVTQIDEVLKKVPDEDPHFLRQYLTEHIRYGLGAEEKRALEKYGALLRKYGLVEDKPCNWSYI